MVKCDAWHSNFALAFSAPSNLLKVRHCVRSSLLAGTAACDAAEAADCKFTYKNITLSMCSNCPAGCASDGSGTVEVRAYDHSIIR